MKAVRIDRKTAVHSGSAFDSFLEEAGIREEVETTAIGKVVAWQTNHPEQYPIKRQRRAPSQPRPKA